MRPFPSSPSSRSQWKDRAGLAACAEEPSEPLATDTDMDSVAAIVEYTNRHDALVSYYYRDVDDTIKVPPPSYARPWALRKDDCSISFRCNG